MASGVSPPQSDVKRHRMRTITTTEALAEYCAKARQQPYVTIDTEFLRERTYYSRLCLIQMALPNNGEAVLIDPIAGSEMKLDPIFELFRDTSVVKVFHAARQDLEIFWFEGEVFPEPLFDTQVAAMVCGFGEQVGYETLVKKIVRGRVDKTSRFTDWSRRPLTDAQKTYAISDVTHLRGIYEELARQLKENGRERWLQEELGILTDPNTYVIDPEQAWRRVKTRTNTGRFLGMVKALAAFRERHAQTNNVPRNRVFKDDALLELASTRPRSREDLGKSRLLLREARKGVIADGIVAAVETGLNMPDAELPKVNRDREKLQVNPAIADMLRVLLKAKSEESGVAAKLIASAADLDGIAGGLREAAALRGWRHEVFGADALRLCAGEIGLTVSGQSVRVIDLEPNGKPRA